MQIDSTSSPPGGSRVPRLLVLAGTLLALAGVASGKTADTALQPGEELAYTVRWAILPGAGEIRIAATTLPHSGSPRLAITTTTETKGWARALLTFRAEAESIFDLQTGRLVELHEDSLTRKKQVEYSVTFDHESGRALFSDERANAARTLEMPEGEPADLITTLMKTRWWDLRVGESQDALVAYRDEFYELTVYAIGVERVKTPLGEFEAVVLEPRMEKTPPKGMFKRGGNVRVWVSRDDERLPVRFQVEFKFGTGVATLARYTPPRAGEPWIGGE